MAVVFAFVAFFIPFLSPRVRSDKALSLMVFLVLIAHQSASLIHVFVEPLPTVNTDSKGFQYFAEKGSGRLFESMFYVQMLHQIYLLFGGSQYLGCQVSQIAFSIGLVALVELLALLELQDKSPVIVGIFGLLPSCILNTSVTMREAFQACLFLSLVYSVLHLRKFGPTVITALVPTTSLGMVLFHNGFAVFVIVALPLSLVWALGSRPQVLIGAVGISFMILTFFGGDLWELMLDKSNALERITSNEGLDYIDNYADQVFEARTDFGVTLDLGSPGEFLRSAPVVVVYYLFSPFPWQVGSVLDVVGFLEGSLRLALFGYALNGIRNMQGEARKQRLFLLAFFMCMELMWAAGTSNVGTAVRHRVPAWGVLVLLGVAGRTQSQQAASSSRERPFSKREAIRRRRHRLSGRVRHCLESPDALPRPRGSHRRKRQ